MSADHATHLDWDRIRVRILASHRGRNSPTWRMKQSWSDNLPCQVLGVLWAGHGRGWFEQGEVLMTRGMAFWHLPGAVYTAEQEQADPLGYTDVYFRFEDPGSGDVLDPADLSMPPEIKRDHIELLQ